MSIVPKRLLNLITHSHAMALMNASGPAGALGIASTTGRIPREDYNIIIGLA